MAYSCLFEFPTSDSPCFHTTPPSFLPCLFYSLVSPPSPVRLRLHPTSSLSPKPPFSIFRAYLPLPPPLTFHPSSPPPPLISPSGGSSPSVFPGWNVTVMRRHLLLLTGVRGAKQRLVKPRI